MKCDEGINCNHGAAGYDLLQGIKPPPTSLYNAHVRKYLVMIMKNA